MYNVKIKRYNDNEMQIKVYSYKVKCAKYDNFERREFENKKLDKYKFVDNPFTQSAILEISSDVEISDLVREEERKKEKNLHDTYKRTKTKIYDLARSNKWELFVTLTFNPEIVDSYDYELCVKKMSQWLNNLKKRKCKDLKYIIVPELHKSGRYHFHALFSNCSELSLVDSSLRDERGRKIYNLEHYNLGWTTATKIRNSSKASNYLTKYISKDLCCVTKNKKRYWSSKNLDVHEEITYLLSFEQQKSLLEQQTSQGFDIKFLKQLNYNIDGYECQQYVYEMYKA